MATGPSGGITGLGGEAGGVPTGLPGGGLTNGTMVGGFATPAGAEAAGEGLTGDLDPFSRPGPNGNTTGANFLFW